MKSDLAASGESQHPRKVYRTRIKRAAGVVARGYQRADRAALGLASKAIPSKTREHLQAHRELFGGNVHAAVPMPGGRTLAVTIPDRLKHLRHAILPAALLVVLLIALQANAALTGYGGTHTVSASGNQAVYEASTSGDSLYVGGTLQGSADFGASYGTTDVKAAAGSGYTTYISKTTGGSYNWTRIITDATGNINVGSIYATTGAVYVTGEFTGDVDFAADFGGEDIKSAGADQYGYVTRINADGSYGWSQTFGSAGAYVQPSSLTYDPAAEAVIATGIFGGGNVQFDASGPVRTAANGNGFVLWLEDQTTSAAYVRDYHLTSTVGIWPTDITATDTQVLLGGNFETDAIFEAGGSSVAAPAAGDDGFIVRLGLDGSYADVQTFGGSGDEIVGALRATPDGSLYVGGTMTASATFRDVGTIAASTNATDSYVLKVSALDVNEWVRTVGGDNAQTSLAGIVVSDKGSIYAGGSYGGTVDFKKSFGGGDAQTSHGTRSAFITVLSDTAYESTHTIGAELEDDPAGSVFGYALASSNPDELIYLAGAFTNTVNFGAAFTEEDSKVSSGANDAFVTALNARDPRTLSGGGLRYLDNQGTNLSSSGTQDLAPTVTILDDDDTYLAQLSVDMSEDRTWSTTGDTDHVEHAAAIANLVGQDGAASSFTFYVPKGETDTAVALCPGATDLAGVSASCTNRETLSEGNGATVSNVEGTDYWVIAGRSDTSLGGISLSYPGIVVTPPAGGTTIAESASATFSVALQVAPTDDVVITPDIDAPTQLSGAAPLTFTAENWQTPQDLVFTATDDSVVDGTSNVSVSLTFASSDTRYDGASEPPFALQVTDNDSAGISWSPSSLMLDEAEAGTASELCLSLTAQPTANVSFALASSDTGEATVASPLVITPANWDAATNCVDVTAVDDSLTDGAQVATISVTGITSDDAAFAGLTGLATVATTVQDDDSAGFVFDSGSGQTTEVGGQVELCVTLTAQPLNSVTLPFQSSDTSEGTLTESEITITPGNWSAGTNCITVTGQDDDLLDGNMTYSIITGDPTSGDPAWDALGAGDVAEVSLSNLDDDEAGITVSESSLAITEGGITDTFTVRLDSQPAPGQEVHLTVSSSGPAQLTASPAMLTFTNTNWSTPQTVTVTAVDDGLLEGAHAGTIAVAVAETTTETPYLLLGDQTLATAITDNDTAEASVTATSNATEGSVDGTLTVALNKVNNTGSPVVVGYEVLGGSTAVAGTHYTALSGSVSIPAGQSSATITIDASGHDNGLFQGDRTVQIQLNAGGSITIGDDDSASVLIIDDESATVSLSASPGQEGGDDVVLTATLSLANNTGGDLVVGLDDMGGSATAGQDYAGFGTASITIANGATTGAYTVTVTDDEILEANTESVSAELSDFPLPAGVSLDGEDFAASTTIIDNDAAEVTITGGSASEPSTPGTFTLTLSKANATGEPIAVSYSVGGNAASGSDFTALDTSVNIPSGSATATVTVTPVDDLDIEDDETVILTLTGTDFARATVGEPDAATVTIADNETAGITVTAPDNTTSEDNTDNTAGICFQLTSRPDADVTIALSSEDTSKVTVPASVTITPGNWNTDTCVTATGHDDDPAAVTGTQAVTITTGDVTSSNAAYNALTGADVADATLQHADNDTPGITVTTVDSTTSEAATDNTATVRFSLSSQPTSDITIALAVDDDTEGTLGATTSVVITNETWDNPSENQITITGVGDALIDGTITYHLVTSASSSSDANYNNLAVSDVTLTNADDDTAGIAINPSGDSLTEGGATLMHAVTVASQPAGGQQISITATPTNSQIALGGEDPGEPVTLTFTNANWNTPQNLTISADDDSLLELAHTSAVTYTLAGSTTDPAYENYEIDPATFAVDITDNDTATAVLSSSDAEEDAGTMTFTATLSKVNNTGAPITATFDTLEDGTATASSDFTAAVEGTISIADGSSTGTATVTIADDELLEGDETVVAQISGSSTPAVTITAGTATATVIDNDNTTATVTANDTTAAENPASNGQFTVSLGTANNTPGNITISYSVGGSATANEDYAALNGAAVIGQGQSSATITVDTSGMDDELVEGNETVILTLTSSDHPLVAVGSSPATVTIVDDDTYTWSLVKVQDGTEADEIPAQFKVVLNKVNNTGSDMSIDVFDTLTGSAASAADYAALSANATITPGENESAIIDIAVTDDLLLESTETIDLALGTPAEGQGSVNELAAAITLAITDNDTATAVLTTGSADESEDAVFTVTLSKTNNTGQPITVDFATSDAAAAAGSDFTAVTDGTISIANGASSGTATVSVIDDNDLENDESFAGGISASSNPAITISDAEATATIEDNETATASVTASTPNAAENPSVAGAFTISLDKPNHTGAPITINYSVGGSATASEDFAPISTSAVIADGQDDVVVTIDTEGYDDELVEGDETVVLTLTATNFVRVGVNTTPAAVTILDDDSYAWSIAKLQDGAEEGSVTGRFRVGLDRTNTTGGPITVTLATSGTATSGADFTAVAGTVTIADGDSYTDITVPVTDDALLESTETIIATLSAPNEGSLVSSTATATIADNDVATAELSTANVAENAGDITFTVTLSKVNNTNAPITFTLDTTGGTATANTDYATISDLTVSVPIGASSASVTTDVVDDILLEGDETAIATLSASSNAAVTIAQSTATATILDNETATASVVTTTPSIAEGAPAASAFTISLSRVNNTPAPITVAYTVSGTATTDADYEALSGTATIGIGASSAVVALTTLEDSDAESAETVIMTLDSTSAPDLVTIGGQNEATVTIVDNDTLSWSITELQDGSEIGPTDAIFRVQLSQTNVTGTDLTATVSDTGSGSAGEDDYEAFGTTVTIAPGNDHADVHVTIADDDLLERTETIAATLGGTNEGDIAVSNATASIADNDTAQLSITATQPTAIEQPTANGQFTISLDKPNNSTAPVIIAYTIAGTATGGEDYALLSGTANIPAGEQSTIMWVDMSGFDDNAYESDETVIVTLSATDHAGVSIGSPASATVTIQSDDAAPQPPTNTGNSGTSVAPAPPIVYVPIPAQQTPTETEQLPEPTRPPVDQISPDQDADNIDDTIEAQAHNSGDGNGDGTPDSMQPNVASIVSAITQRPVTLAVTGECPEVQKFTVVAEHELDKSDLGYRYPHGLVDFQVGCNSTGKTAEVAIYYDDDLGSSYVWRKLTQKPELAFASMQQAQQTLRAVGQSDVTAILYDITDGDEADDDGKADGKIIDPAGFAASVIQPVHLWWLLPLIALAGFLITRAAVHHHREHRANQAKITRW